jgi:large subunit ribosomal protein L23
MAINIFKKEKKAVAKKPAAPKAEGGVVLSKKSWNILKSPCITEKATSMAGQGNFYMFEVNDSANKIEIKKAVEEKYKVNVLQVRTINIHRKKIKRGKTEGFRKGYKKAIVKVKEGQNIEIIAQ